ncbi:MAG: hypothetical protein IIZ80_04735 [Erysipelotrichaceae bacterium]|nr:hypothetical protein [Erysipelotrichaceae bacterium]
MKKKTVLITLTVLLLGGAIVFGLLFSKRFTHKMSLAQLKKRQPQYTGLVGASLSHGGGMNGERYLTSIEYDKDRKIIYTTEESPEHFVPALITVYEVEDPDAMNKLDAYVAEYNMSVWDKIPESGIEVLDAPGTSLHLRFKASEDQRFADSMTIDYDLDLSNECFDVLHDFTKKMGSYPMKQIDRYFSNYNDENIYLGKDIENSDEQIGHVLCGYFCNDEKNVFADLYEGNLRIRGIYSDEFVDYELKDAQIVHEQLKDHDSSWYVKYGSDEKTLSVTCTYTEMYIEDSQGNTYVLERSL